ncbi:MAG TPA: metal-sulfur cluster assembly factor [Longimicrobiaceae bacterium]|nr:metal-sulfur cluster assembly factor [Longimicrobiaceae bacterium]
MPACASSPARFSADGFAASAVLDAPSAYPVPFDEREGPLWDALREVMDPEIPISLVDLGLIYDIRQDGGRVDVDLTFTATACPCMAFIHFDIQDRLRREPGVDEVVVNEVWTPAWTKARITPEGREALRTFGVSM